MFVIDLLFITAALLLFVVAATQYLFSLQRFCFFSSVNAECYQHQDHVWDCKSWAWTFAARAIVSLSNWSRGSVSRGPQTSWSRTQESHVPCVKKNQRPALRRWSLVMMVPHCKFGFFFNHVMKVLHFGVLRSSSLVFVDDEVMLVTSGGHSRMIINISSRSETVVLSWKEVTSPLRVKNKLLHQVEKFRYLGVFFTREGSRRLWTWMKWCRRCICRFSEERVKHESEVMIHLSIYVPTLAYGHSSE